MHAAADWVPGAHQIRPSPAVLALKAGQMATVEHFYATLTDYIGESVFGYRTRLGDDGKLTAAAPMDSNTGDEAARGGKAHAAAARALLTPTLLGLRACCSGRLARRRVFAPNQFPYELSPGAHHWLLW
jgi:hypothetical protein